MSGQILYSKNLDLRRPPASTTKIMTAILLIENTQPDDIITASRRAFDTEGSSLNLKPGERMTARDLLYALMLRSANDGCIAAAEHIAGSEARFAQMMTEKASQIGATNTLFRNCNGLNEKPNYTTARDLALIARYATRYPEFNEVTRTKMYTVTRTLNPTDSVLKNHAKFLWKFPGADGIKTGYTRPAGRCFVGSATWNGWRLISVVLNSPDVIAETAQLMKYGFYRFDMIRLASGGTVYANVPVRAGNLPAVPAAARDPIQYVAPKGIVPRCSLEFRCPPVEAPITEGAPVGTMEAIADGRVVGTTPLVATCAVERVESASPSIDPSSFFLLGLAGMVVIGCGTTIAKAARRRGYRLTSLLRGPDRGGPGPG